jgi:hypothetical protein
MRNPQAAPGLTMALTERSATRRCRQLILSSVFALATATGLRADETWTLSNLANLGGHPVKVLGAPTVLGAAEGGGAIFNGSSDGLLVSAIPIAGANAFTIEALISPAEGGPEAQRFLHFEDPTGRRGLMEIRTNGKGGWWLDTYLRSGRAPTDAALTLIDPARVHPTNRPYWVALRYDGAKMADFVNGAKELEGEIVYPPVADGTTSIGVRQNLVYWFKGTIRAVRFHRVALPEDELQRVK